MTFLLDTNVVSEWVKPAPAANVVTWLATVDEDVVYMSVASFAEIGRGIAAMPVGRHRKRLEAWIDDELPTRFERRILDIDRAVADAWGTVVARAQRAGLTMSTMDAFFAATALVHGLTLVTRNVRDFQHAGIALLDPWATSR